MKPAVWRIFQNNRWSYSDTPSTRHQDRAAWQPLYAQPEKAWVGLTDEEAEQLIDEHWEDLLMLMEAIEAKLKEKNSAT